MRRALATSAAIVCLFATCSSETKPPPPPDISAIAAAGQISGTKYTNFFFKLAVECEQCELTLNPLVNQQQGRARLLQIISTQQGRDDTFTFGVLADTRARYPQLQSAEHYVRSVRHQLEKEGLRTVREEFQLTISGLPFAGAILRVDDGNGRYHYRGIYTIFRSGFILSFDAEGASEEKVNALAMRLVRFVK